MDPRRTGHRRILLASVFGALVAVGSPLAGPAATGHASAGTSLREQSDGLLKNVEEMVAHGGMGDAHAIVHHCGEAARHAEGLLTQLAPSDPRAARVMPSLNEVIRHCRRVSELGRHADPGLLLNPAIKARTAARESVKALGVGSGGGS